MLQSIRRDKRKAAAELKAQKESELRTQEREEPQEQKEEEIATENPNNHSHDLHFEPHDLPSSRTPDPLPQTHQNAFILQTKMELGI